MRREMTARTYLLASILVWSLACGRREYGEIRPIGTIVETQTVQLSVPLEMLRVSIDNPHHGDVVMHEDFGSGLDRGMVLLVQSRAGVLTSSVLSDLKLFRGPERGLLDEAEMLDESETSGVKGMHYFLRIPPIERPSGFDGRLVERPTLYMIGDLYEDDGSICRLQVGWNPLAEEGPGIDERHAGELERARDALRRLRAAVRKCGGSVPSLLLPDELADAPIAGHHDAMGTSCVGVSKAANTR